MSCLYVKEEIVAHKMQDNKFKVLPLCHFYFCSFFDRCAHTGFFSFSAFLHWLKYNIQVSSCYTGGVLSQSDLSSLQEGCVSTPETCPYRPSSFFPCIVKERTRCWLRIEVSIFWAGNVGEEKIQHQQGLYHSVKHTAEGLQSLNMRLDIEH